jgi:uncharacterized protein YaaQ
MKMLVAILKDEDAESVINGLSLFGLCVTRIASTGGFFRKGRSTLMVSVTDEKVDLAIETINDNCAPTIEPISRRATIFVLNVEHFEQI